MTTPPEAKDRLTHPWRFRIGDIVYVRRRKVDDTFKVIAGELWLGWPHLIVVDIINRTWRVAQIECSSRPIVFRKS